MEIGKAEGAHFYETKIAPTQKRSILLHGMESITDGKMKPSGPDNDIVADGGGSNGLSKVFEEPIWSIYTESTEIV